MFLNLFKLIQDILAQDSSRDHFKRKKKRQGLARHREWRRLRSLELYSFLGGPALRRCESIMYGASGSDHDVRHAPLRWPRELDARKLYVHRHAAQVFPHLGLGGHWRARRFQARRCPCRGILGRMGRVASSGPPVASNRARSSGNGTAWACQGNPGTVGGWRATRSCAGGGGRRNGSSDRAD